jgi:hypothetical protein
MMCKRHKTLNVEVDPGILPEDQIKDALVFEVSGVNLAGPLIFIGGQKHGLRSLHMQYIERCICS